MEITCGVCGRFFEVDDQLAAKHRAARCVCESRLELIKTSGGPQRLGKYLLQRRIAVGGMGEIFYGKIAGIEGFEREVAIKKMLPHLSADRNFIDMIIKEAKLTVLLNHPNIVQVYDLSREGNEYYIAMEFVPGTNVGSLLEKCHQTRELLPWEVAVHITMQILRGLAYAHDLRGPDGEPMHILHRDITPQNVLVTPNAFVKITDFGIAKARNEISTTSPGMIKGKLGYIAPEQLQGQKPDQRADLFCAGICLWESLAARRLFKGADEIDTFRLIAEAKIPALSSVRDDVPPAVEEALRGALTRHADDRYVKADDFYDALNQAIYPRTPDELAKVAQEYFREHPEYFDNNPQDDGASLDPRTATLDLAPPSDEELRPITELLKRPKSEPRQRSRAWIAVLATLVVVALGGAGLWYARDFVDLPTSIARPTTPTPEPTPRPTNVLTQSEVELAVRAEEARVRECYCEQPASLKGLSSVAAKLTIASTGGVANVTLDPAKLGAAGECVSETLRALRFRPHDLPQFEATVDLPSPKALSCPKQADAGKSTNAAAGHGSASTPLSAEEIQRAVQRHSQSIVGCLQRFEGQRAPPKVDARLTIGTDGRVDRVDFTPDIDVAAVNGCLQKSLKSIRFRRHPVKDFKVTIPLKIQVL